MSSKGTVLVIDDDPAVADALAMILSDSGYRIVVAVNGRDALNKADNESFDAAITDIGLPDMSGLDVLRQLRGRHPDVGVIIITAHTTPEIIREAITRGAVDVLQKPFLPSDVLDLVDMTLSNRRRT